MTISCRCRKCGSRRSLRLKPESYIRVPKCGVCGEANWRIDFYRMKREKGRLSPTCYCSGYHFPHREGSLFCQSRPDAEEIWNATRGARYQSITSTSEGVLA